MCCITQGTPTRFRRRGVWALYTRPRTQTHTHARAGEDERWTSVSQAERERAEKERKNVSAVNKETKKGGVRPASGRGGGGGKDRDVRGRRLSCRAVSTFSFTNVRVVRSTARPRRMEVSLFPEPLPPSCACEPRLSSFSLLPVPWPSRAHFCPLVSISASGSSRPGLATIGAGARVRMCERTSVAVSE